MNTYIRFFCKNKLDTLRRAVDESIGQHNAIPMEPSDALEAVKEKTISMPM